ncbi:MAG: saccharopine dehydrogenase C-terminal domain-containing protein [Desulfobacterales bacterium]
MKKNILVLGAGFVARPLVRYLLKLPDVSVTVASRTLDRAQHLVGDHARGNAETLQVENTEKLSQSVSAADIVISLLPWIHHIQVAKQCLAHGRHLVTTSYVKPEMEALDAEVRKKNLLFLNEIGVDPGIDHMAAMRVIDRVRKAGGTITSFYSYCGGLPAPECNSNPFGYKFSWSPLGVMLAALSDGRYMEEGKIIDIPAEKLFQHYRFIDIPDAGIYEAYVNRDKLPYRKIYGTESTVHVPGNPMQMGHCESSGTASSGWGCWTETKSLTSADSLRPKPWQKKLDFGENICPAILPPF